MADVKLNKNETSKPAYLLDREDVNRAKVKYFGIML